MTFDEIAQELVTGCREGRERENLDKLYAADAVSVEAVDFGRGRQVRGLDAIKAKHEWFESTTEILDAKVRGPWPGGTDQFAVIFEMKAKEKASGKITDEQEVAMYTVKDGKIVREEFFYEIPLSQERA